MDDLRGGMTTEAAKDAISVLLSGTVTELTEHTGGGWSVEMENITKSAVDLLDDHETFNYCHVETIFDNDMAYYRETVMQDIPCDEGCGIVVEGTYQRKVETEDRPDATFTGRIAYANPADWNRAMRTMEQSFAERTFEEYLNNLRYLQDGMWTILHHLQDKLPPERMAPALSMLGRLNRTVIDMGTGHAV